VADGIGRTGSGVWGNRRRPIAGDAVGHDWGPPEPLGPSCESFHAFMIFDEVDRDGHVARGRSRSCSPARCERRCDRARRPGSDDGRLRETIGQAERPVAKEDRS
jgi:hypothetical protein